MFAEASLLAGAEAEGAHRLGPCRRGPNPTCASSTGATSQATMAWLPCVLLHIARGWTRSRLFPELAILGYERDHLSIASPKAIPAQRCWLGLMLSVEVRGPTCVEFWRQ